MREKRAVERLYMRIGELAERWDISLAHCYRLVERGDVASLKAGGAVRIPIAGIEAYERAQGSPATREGRTA